ncbi:MAG: hypothetical protein ACUVRO_12905 [Armatimonadota bacterium]
MFEQPETAWHRLPDMLPEDPLIWDYVGFWHFPCRGVLDYNEGWSDNRKKWRHNVARLDGSVKQIGFWPIMKRAEQLEAVSSAERDAAEGN